MISKAKIRAVWTHAADELTALVCEHERESHGGKTCSHTRCWIAAMMCHELGVASFDLSHMLLFGSFLKDIERSCDKCQKAMKGK